MISTHRLVPTSFACAALLVGAGIVASTVPTAPVFAEAPHVFVVSLDEGEAETLYIDELAPGESQQAYTASGEHVVVTREVDGYSVAVGDHTIHLPATAEGPLTTRDIEVHADGEHSVRVFHLRGDVADPSAVLEEFEGLEALEPFEVLEGSETVRVRKILLDGGESRTEEVILDHRGVESRADGVGTVVGDGTERIRVIRILRDESDDSDS